MTSTRLLCIGDIHLGRRPSRIPADLREYGVDVADLTPAAAWRRLIDVAIEQRVQGVVLAGDVVESDNHFFEAYGPLHAGVTRLAKAGIPVFGVAGNHDTEVLPRLADEVTEFHLLGRGGRWEAGVIEPPDRPPVRLLGWSFPEKVVRTSPLDSVPRPANDVATIGVLHCDLDARNSAYAPISSAALAAAPGDAWLLGHIHAPSAQPGPSPRGYLGDLTALDPGEQGERGAWILDVKGPNQVVLERLRVAPLRWETVEADITDLADPEQAPGAITRAIHALHARIGPSRGEARAVGCRVRLVGTSHQRRAAVAAVQRSEPAILRMALDRCVYFVESCTDATQQALDLPTLALTADPPGLLARMLLAIDGNTPEGQAVVRDALAELNSTTALSQFATLDPIADLEAVTRAHLLTAGRAALEDLVAQREAT